MSNHELDKSDKNNAYPIVILVIRHVSRRKSVIIMWERDQVNDVDIYERPSPPRPPTFTCHNNVEKKSIK